MNELAPFRKCPYLGRNSNTPRKGQEGGQSNLRGDLEALEGMERRKGSLRNCGQWSHSRSASATRFALSMGSSGYNGRLST